MSRRRTGARHVPITIALKPSMVNDIEAQLDAKESRSAWIAAAIAKELAGESEWNVYRDGTAMHMFNVFKAKMEKEGVRIDHMFYDMIASNIRNHADSKANSLETTDQAESEK